MANRTTSPLSAGRTDEVLLTAKIVGNGTSTPTMGTQESANGEIVSLNRTGTGVSDIVFRHSYPEFKVAPGASFGPATTTGLVMICTAYDPVAKTATIKFSVGGVATDPATTDTITLYWVVRNSGKNA
jgi:hypothetical protein